MANGEKSLSWIEKLSKHMPEPKSPGQLRSFGLIVATGFAVIGLWPAVFRGHPFRAWALVLSAALLIPALVLPSVLRPFFRGWMLVGHCLGWVNTRIILSLLFFLVFTPIAFVMRLMGRDSMAREAAPNVESYRRPKAPRPASHLKHQF
jgi:saxitoxin biosynthesis operon SxtJ-like protein